MTNSFNEKLKNISIIAGALTFGALAALLINKTLLSFLLFLDIFVLSIFFALLYSRYNTLNLKKISFVRSIERDFEALKIYKKIDEQLFEVPKIKIFYQNNKIKKIRVENSPVYSEKLRNFDWSATIENAELEKMYLDKKNLVFEFALIDEEDRIEAIEYQKSDYFWTDKQHAFKVRQHVAITGVTGSGKTYFLREFLKQLKANQAKFYLVDAKRVGLQLLAQQFGADLAVDSSEILTTMRAIVDELKQREREFLKNNDFEDCYLVIDELSALRYSLDKNEVKEFDKLFSQIVLKGRELRVFAIVALQSAHATVFPTEFRDQFALRIALGQCQRSTYEVLFGGTFKPNRSLGAGEGYFIEAGTNVEPLRFYAPTVKG